MASIRKNTIFTNVAQSKDNDVWWEGMGYPAPGPLTDWTSQPWESGTNNKPAAHPNARFTAPASQCPTIAPEWEDPNGVPISAILFGGRRPGTVPLVHEAFDWNHGVFLGSIVGSEVTAAALDLTAGTVRRDPFAMLPFCGYNMGDYFHHWIKVGSGAGKDALPKIFFVNWFRKTDDGKWLWPGYGENSRVLKWVFERCDGSLEAEKTAIGLMPRVSDIDLTGLEEVSRDDMEELLTVNKAEWLSEVASIKEHYAKFGNHLPGALSEQLAALEERLAAM
jgi:phosphoenolpyruvate carboxykinase (GTP)